MSTTTPGIGGGNSFGYKELFLDKDAQGKSLNDTISDRFKEVTDAKNAMQANPQDPAKLMALQLAMNNLQQILSSTTQLMNSMKGMNEGINRNI